MRPFSGGSQCRNWISSNCDRCAKGAHRLGPDALPDCEIELAIGEAYFDDGNITDTIAARMGDGAGRYCWKCAELTDVEDNDG